ncbi:MAG: isochorismatase family protein [Opitutaceae bacterium]
MNSRLRERGQPGPQSSEPPVEGASPADGALLLCVDMQPVFLRAMAEGVRVQQRCKLAIAAAHGLGLPVIFTEQVPEKLGRTASELIAVAPGAAVFGKNTFSAFADGRTREAIIQEINADHVIVCGIETPICVYQTAIAALVEGIEVTILSDAVGARRPDDARTCLEELSRAGAHVLPTESVFYALLRDAKHPFFRTYTELVKAHG